MPSQSLYRKWRSQTFRELVGQEHVARTLLNALKTGRLAHAYLFCGPRGTGKTSTARILAKAVNCYDNEGQDEPCDRCSMCVAIREGHAFDIIEIDAASNRGIDDIRDLREKVRLAPSEARYKFYIIDEVHQLTREAFNALLKTLEEPPEGTIFVLASTEPHRIPLTIISRCQRFDFRPIKLKDMLQHLERICREENITIEPEALEHIVRVARGSLRDAESILDQMRLYSEETITLADVQAVLGTAGLEVAAQLVRFLVERELKAGLQLINKAVDDGIDVEQLAKGVVDYLRNLLLLRTGQEAAILLEASDENLREMERLAKSLSTDTITRYIRLFAQLDWSPQALPKPQLPLELAFVEALGPEEPPTKSPLLQQEPPAKKLLTPSLSEPPTDDSAISSVRETPPESHPDEKSIVRDASEGTLPSDTPTLQADTPTLQHLTRAWPQVLGLLERNRFIQALLRDLCEPVEVADSKVTIAVSHEFYLERIQEPKSRALVERAISQVLGRPCRVVSVYRPRAKRSAADDNLVQAAIKMGGRIKKVNTLPHGEGESGQLEGKDSEGREDETRP